MKRFSLSSSSAILVQAVISCVLLYSAYGKITDIFSFTEILSYYRYIPSGWQIPIAFAVPILELLIGLAIWVPGMRKTAVWAYQGLLFAFILLLSLNVGQTMPYGCGCFGPGDSTVITWAAIGRDALLLIPAWILLYLMKK
jgi:uncharacterized membrane protein YphA (DoxX/SURF4 family)